MRILAGGRVLFIGQRVSYRIFKLETRLSTVAR